MFPWAAFTALFLASLSAAAEIPWKTGKGEIAKISKLLDAAGRETPARNDAERARSVPDADILASIQARLMALRQAIDSLPKDPSGRPPADADIYANAVDLALRNGEWTVPQQAEFVQRTLAWGEAVAAALKEDSAALSKARGSFVFGHRSKVDGSAQPCAVALPREFNPSAAGRYRLYVYLHGWSAWRTEPAFLCEAVTRSDMEDAQTIRLEPFGRWNAAFRWAAEADVFEAIEEACRRYPIDPNQIVLGGFSMGGGGALTLGLLHPSKFAAVAPMAAAYEAATIPPADKLPPFRADPPRPEAMQERLARVYGANGHAINAMGLPLFMSVGSKDKFAASQELMWKALERAGVKAERRVIQDIEHVEAPLDVRDRRTFLLANWRNPEPQEVYFATANLRHAERDWIRIEGMMSHYSLAKVHAKADPKTSQLDIETSGVTRLSIRPGEKVLPRGKTQIVKVDKTPFTILGPSQWTEMEFKFGKNEEGKEMWLQSAMEPGLRKRPSLQGPLDDAFASPFLCVRPTGTGWNDDPTSRSARMLEALEKFWPWHYRAELPVKDDTKVSDEDLRNHNLVLFGDGASNRLVAEFLERAGQPSSDGKNLAPISWTKDEIRIGKHKYASKSHLPVLIYPSPWNPRRLVALNAAPSRPRISRGLMGVLPALGDFAVIDLAVKVPPATRDSDYSDVVLGGFWDENWRYPQ